MITHVVALPKGLTQLSLAALPRERWRNGKGWTRPVAQGGPAGAPSWRVSLAEITEAAPFSAFPGMDRTTVLVDGGPVSLVAPHQQWALSEPGDRAHYGGELPLHNTAPERDTLFWNVMTTRGRVSASVHLLHGALALPEQGHSLVWVLRGGYTLAGQPLPGLIHLGPQEGLHWRGGQHKLMLRATEPDSLLLHTLLTE